MKMRGVNAPRGGYREDIGIYVRSSWEANYCRYLNWLRNRNLIEEWKYEPQPPFKFEGIKRGCREYLPDFKVTYPGGRIEYHEVKGYMDQKSRTKLKRMAKYHPTVVIKLIDKRFYEDLCRKLAAAISGWE